MTTPTTRTVLFVDVTGSTRLYEALGDAHAHAAIERRLRRVEAAVAGQGGRVVKHLGDGLMCAFTDASAAVRAADAMQADVASEGPGADLSVHVGCHCGPVLEAGGDLYGDSVNVAARIAGLAKAGQVLLTRELANALDAELRASVRRLGSTTVKGRRERIEILEFVREGERAEELTVVRESAVHDRAARLVLVIGPAERAFDGSDAITLGRDPASDVVVGDREASRRHARIEKRGDHFVLVDHSANGTWLAMPGEGEQCVRREEAILRGHGRFALGRPTADPSATVLEFRCD